MLVVRRRGEDLDAGSMCALDVVAFGRDLQVSYRVWSPKSGYPGHAAYRDFHTYDHVTGLKPARVTGRNVPSDAKAPYDPQRADRTVDIHVADFVGTVRDRLISESERIGRPAHVVAAFDTELFGHWWYEGPAWLERVLRALVALGLDDRQIHTAYQVLASYTTGFVQQQSARQHRARP